MKKRTTWDIIVFLLACMVVVSLPALAKEPVIIQMMQFAREAEVEWQEAVIAEFHKDQSRIRVELIHPGNQAVGKAISMLAAGIPPHIAYGDPEHTIFWGRQGVAMDLTPYLQQDMESLFSEYHPTVLDIHAAEGRQFGIPLDLQVQGFYYSEAAFDEAGLAYPDADWTWETVERNAVRLTVDRDNDGVPDRWGMRDPHYLNWWPLLWHFGGEFVDDAKRPTAFIGDSPEVQTALEWVHRMVYELEAMPVPESLSGGTAAQLVATQEIAMSIDNSLRLQEFDRLNSDIPWNVAPLPSGPHGNASQVNAIGWAIFGAAGDHDEAWEVIKYFSSEKAMEMSVMMRGGVVPHMGVARDVWLTVSDVPANRHVFVESVNNSRALPVLTDRAWTATYRYPRWYWFGRMTLAEAMEQIRVDVEAWIGETFSD